MAACMDAVHANGENVGMRIDIQARTGPAT